MAAKKKTTRKAARKVAPKAAPTTPRKPAVKGRRPPNRKGQTRAGKPTRGLEELIQQAMTDDAFIKGLETRPAATLKEQGYPYDRALVREIKSINFDVFRRTFRRPRRAILQFC